MAAKCFSNGTVILADRLLYDGCVWVTDGRILLVMHRSEMPSQADDVDQIDLQGGYLAPGYVDLHVHGGAGADFMDGTEEAFRTICQAHARHGTTSLLPTTTVARHEQHLAFLESCRKLRDLSLLSTHSWGALLWSLFRAGSMWLPSEGKRSFADKGGIRTIPGVPGLHRHGHGCARTARRRGVCPRVPKTRHYM